MCISVNRVTDFLRDERGNASLEFVIAFPFFMALMFMMGEVAVFQTRAILLDRGVDLAMRDLRIGALKNPTHNRIKDKICQGAFLIESTCNAGLRIEFIPVNPATGDFERTQPSCRDLPAEADELNPIIFDVNAGQRGEIMFMSVCLVVHPFIPGGLMGTLLRVQSPISDSTRYALIAQSAFMNEP